MSNLEKTIAPERKISVFSSGQNNRKVDIMSTATTWEELQRDFSNAGVNHKGMDAVVRATKVTLTLPDAKLPDGDFLLYLLPQKTQSGADLSYKELRAAISDIIKADGDEAKNHFNQGKNYTTKSTNELQNLYKSYKGAGKTATTKPVVTSEKKVAVSNVVSSVRDNAAKKAATEVKESPKKAQSSGRTGSSIDNAEQALHLIESISDDKVNPNNIKKATDAIKVIISDLNWNEDEPTDDELAAEFAGIERQWKNRR
jgi:hypothetical protein